MLSNQHHKDIFERLRNGEVITPNDPEAFKLRDASFATKNLLVQLNNSSNPEEMRDLLRQITASDIDDSVAVFTPLYINYGKHTKIGKNVFINFDCVFLDLGGITIEDNVLIAPKVSLLSEGHPVDPNERQSLVPGHIHIRAMHGLVQVLPYYQELLLEKTVLLRLVLWYQKTYLQTLLWVAFQRGTLKTFKSKK